MNKNGLFWQRGARKYTQYWSYEDRISKKWNNIYFTIFEEL